MAILNLYKTQAEELKAGGARSVKAWRNVNAHLSENDPSLKAFWEMIPEADREAIKFGVKFGELNIPMPADLLK